MTIGGDEINPNAALEIKSETGALLLPRLTNAQRNALHPTDGMIIYNVEDQKFQGFVGDSGVVTVAASDVSNATYFIGDDGTNVDFVAQTFTTSFQGQVQSIDFKVSSLSPGFQLKIELYEGDTPGIGTWLHEKIVTVQALGWNTVAFPGNNINANTTYHIILKPAEVSSDFLGLLRSNSDPIGEHTGGMLFSYNSSTGLFVPSPVDDLDFRINALVNTKAWVNLH